MPASKKSSVAASKASTATPRPRGRPATKKIVKSAEFIDDEAEEVADTSSDDDMRSVKSTASRSRPRAATKVTTKKVIDDDDILEISSGDDAMSVKSTKSTKSRSIVPKTPSSRTSSLSRKRSASLMTSPITDDEEFEMLASPTKSATPAQRVRFKAVAATVTPIKGVLKKPEVVIPKSVGAKSIYDGWDDDDDEEKTTPTTKTNRHRGSTSRKDRLASDFAYDSDDGVLLSGFEEDSDVKSISPVKRMQSKGNDKNALSDDNELGPKAKAKNDVFLDDFGTSVPSPNVDESDIGNRDPKLIRTYKGLVNIRAACMVSWSTKPHIFPSYSEVLVDLPRINKEFLFQAVTFAGVGGIRNLSRSDPAKISTGVGSQTHFHALGGSSPLTFVSTMIVHGCSLQEPKMASNGKWHKSIEGACIEGEWERLTGSIGMIANLADYKAQFVGGDISFTTAYAPQDYAGPSTSRGSRRVSGPNPFARGPSGMGGGTLSCYDIVPIYDARKCQTSFYETILDIDKLNRVKREVPLGSCAVVAYTVNTWGITTPPSVSFNVKWVMILATPGAAVSGKD